MKIFDNRLPSRIFLIALLALFSWGFLGVNKSVNAETIENQAHCEGELVDQAAKDKFTAELRKLINGFSGFREEWRPIFWGTFGTYVFSDRSLPEYKLEAVYNILAEHLGKNQADIILGEDVQTYQRENLIVYPQMRQALRFVGVNDPNLVQVPEMDVELVVASYLRLKNSEPPHDVNRSRLGLIWANKKYAQQPWFEEMMLSVEDKVSGTGVERAGFMKGLSEKLGDELTMNRNYWLREVAKSATKGIPSPSDWKKIAWDNAIKSANLGAIFYEFSDFHRIRELKDFLAQLEDVKTKMDAIINARSAALTAVPSSIASSSSPPSVAVPTPADALNAQHHASETQVQAIDLASLRRSVSDAQSILSPLVRELVKADAEDALPGEGRIEGKDLDVLRRFHDFFNKLNLSFLERESLIEALKLVFINKGSLLLLGYTGTGKSAVADAVGENVVDRETGKDSYFSLQMTQETTTSETMGGIIVEEAMKGRTLRNYEQSVLGSAIVFLDEFFDARLKFIRHFLKAFNERKHTQGRSENTYHGITKVFLAASNLYLNQIYEYFGNNSPQAVIDRFSIVAYFPGNFADIRSILAMAKRKKFTPEEPFFLDEIDSLNEKINAVGISPAMVMHVHYIFEAMKRKVMAQRSAAIAQYISKRRENVQPPYHSTRIFSPRTLDLSFTWVKSYALLNRAAKSNSLELVVTPEDVEQALDYFYRLQGPGESFLERLRNIPDRDPYEAAQQDTVDFEMRAYREVINELHEKQRELDLRLNEILGKLRHNPTPDQASPAYTVLNDFISELTLALADFDQPEKIDANKIAALEMLRKIFNRRDLAQLLL